MSKLETLLNERVGALPSHKVKALAKQSADGSLTTFSGLFKVTELSSREKGTIESILLQYKQEDAEIERDLNELVSLTCEVKAIHNQAALLHGERIKRAQTLLKSYRDGAFTAWLYAAYGNRQTPYNFLLYFDFCQLLQPTLRSKVDIMPRQAIYTLASRAAPLERKEQFISTYSGETKRETLELIRAQFPLSKDDKRRSDEGQMMLIALQKLMRSYKRVKGQIHSEKKDEIKRALSQFVSLLRN